MKEKIFEDLAAFLHEQSGAFEVPITLNTSIENDLGITGEDGEELIVNFSKRYNINIDNFYFMKYFNPEPFISRIPDEVKILTVSHLMKAIAVGRLADDVIDS